MDVESAEVKRGAEELIKILGSYISLEEAVKYALATPEHIELLEQAVKQREADVANGLKITNYGKLEI